MQCCIEQTREPGGKARGLIHVSLLIFIGLDLEKTDESRSPDVLTVAVSSAVAVFFFISLFTFVAGFVCGHYFVRKCSVQPPSSNQPVPLYEDVNELPNAVEHQEQGLELKVNVAYGQSTL